VVGKKYSTYHRRLNVLRDVNLHLHRALEVLDKLGRDAGNMVDFLVVKYGRESGLLHCLGGEGLAEEVVGDICHLAEHGQIRGALDLQLVGPRLACNEVTIENINIYMMMMKPTN
jgi:hypothetical protein